MLFTIAFLSIVHDAKIADVDQGTYVSPSTEGVGSAMTS